MTKREWSPVLLVVGGVSLGVMSCALAGFVGSLFMSAGQSPQLASVPDRYAEILMPESEEAAPADDGDMAARSRNEEGKVGRKDARRDKADDDSDFGGIGPGGLGSRGSGLGGGGVGERAQAPKKSVPASQAPAEPAATTRSWFPETFLWSPRVRTDAQGEAELTVTVPDQLSTWRVLGLSAADDGSVSGGTLTFDSTLEVFVEPAPLPFLRQGDRVALPVRVGNLGDNELRGSLRVRGERLSGSLQKAVRVPPGRSVVEVAQLRAGDPGPGVVEAQLEGRDTSIGEFEVLARGRRVVEVHTGLLGGTQEILLELPPGTTFARVSTTVVPGPAGVLRGELSSGHRGTGTDVSALARSVALGALGPRLLERLGESTNDSEVRAFRALRLRAQPGLVKRARGHSQPVLLSQALMALEAAGDDPLAAPLAEQIRARLLAAQGLDGSWSVPDGASLSRLVATTAWVALVLDDDVATLRAEAVFERYLPVLLEQDPAEPATLALVLAAAELDSDRRAAVEGRIAAARTALEADPELLQTWERLDGAELTEADLAIALGLGGVEPAAALHATQSWSPSAGLGDGLTALGWLRLLEAADPVAAEPFEVALELAGETESLTVKPGVSPAAVVLPVPVGGAAATLNLTTAAGQTAVGWQARVEAWVPWTDPGNPLGLLAELEHDELAVGRAAEVRLYLEGPDIEGVTATIALPAGVQPLEDGLEGAEWVTRGDGEVRLRLPDEREARHEVRFTVVPALGGELWSGAAQVGVPKLESEVVVPPTIWSVSG